jgi:cytochrome c biogenesis protein CcmG/thiol:disulfide interchange protein DsbE
MTELTNPGDAGTDNLPADAPASAPANTKAVRAWMGVFVLILIAFVGLLAVRLLQTNQTEQRAAGEAPPFTFTTFDGATISLDDLRGQGVVLNFWASWCDPCREEAALLESTWQQEKDNGIVFLGLDYLDQEPAALKYLAEYGITYPNGPDLQSAAARRYGIKGVPETFFIDPAGKIQEVIVGPITNQAHMNALLDSIRPQ